MAIVAQPYRGHLNGNVNDEFDMEECFARATVAGTRTQSLTVIVSPLDMQEMIGMMQVLAGRAHTIHEVYRGNDNWQLSQLEESQVEQSNAEVQSWRISHAGTWQNKTSHRWPSALTSAVMWTAKNELSFFGLDWYLSRPVKFLVPVPTSRSWST